MFSLCLLNQADKTIIQDKCDGNPPVLVKIFHDTNFLQKKEDISRQVHLTGKTGPFIS